jgi:hypothetical protein
MKGFYYFLLALTLLAAWLTWQRLYTSIKEYRNSLLHFPDKRNEQSLLYYLLVLAILLFVLVFLLINI